MTFTANESGATMTPRALDTVSGAQADPTMTVVEVTVDGDAFWNFYNAQNEGTWIGQYRRESQSVRVMVDGVPAHVMTEDTVVGRVLRAAVMDEMTIVVLRW